MLIKYEYLEQGISLGMVMCSRKYLVMFGDISGCYNWGWEWWSYWDPVVRVQRYG
jgi:hypothetical protein